MMFEEGGETVCFFIFGSTWRVSLVCRSFEPTRTTCLWYTSCKLCMGSDPHTFHCPSDCSPCSESTYNSSTRGMSSGPCFRICAIMAIVSTKVCVSLCIRTKKNNSLFIIGKATPVRLDPETRKMLFHINGNLFNKTLRNLIQNVYSRHTKVLHAWFIKVSKCC